jgi:hypothetical protein
LLLSPLALASLTSFALAPDSLEQLRVLSLHLAVDRLELRAKGVEA